MQVPGPHFRYTESISKGGPGLCISDKHLTADFYVFSSFENQRLRVCGDEQSSTKMLRFKCDFPITTPIGHVASISAVNSNVLAHIRLHIAAPEASSSVAAPEARIITWFCQKTITIL